MTNWRRSMKRIGLVLAVLVAMVTAPAHAKDKDTNGVAIPVAASNAAGNSFTGTFTLQRFTTDAGKLVAVGTVAGTLTDSAGKVVTTAFQTVTVPVQVNNSAQGPAPAAVAQVTASCSILHLDLGPLTLNLLGLQVDLSRVV